MDKDYYYSLLNELNYYFDIGHFDEEKFRKKLLRGYECGDIDYNQYIHLISLMEIM